MGQIKVTKCEIEGLCVIEPTVHRDARGYFVETYNANDMKEAGLDMVFVQDNQSRSSHGVLRGLHFQKQFPQGKLVRVLQGSVYDVAVDLRKDSKTFGKWYGVDVTWGDEGTTVDYRWFMYGRDEVTSGAHPEYPVYDNGGVLYQFEVPRMEPTGIEYEKAS